MSKKSHKSTPKEDFPEISDGEICLIEDSFLVHKCCDCGMVHLIVFDGAFKNDEGELILIPLKDTLALRFYRIKDGKTK